MLRPTDEQLAEIGFEKITDINPQPSGRASFAYRSRRGNLEIHVWETGNPELDGALVFDYFGGNIVPVQLDWLEKLGQLVDSGHQKLELTDEASFTWGFGEVFFLETAKGNFEWSDSSYPRGDNTIRPFDGSYNEWCESQGIPFGRDKGKAIIESRCGSAVTILS